jgi:uncharacterized iron-regulated membrane protein
MRQQCLPTSRFGVLTCFREIALLVMLFRGLLIWWQQRQFLTSALGAG